jgi:FkbM family methyltransferase
MWRFRTNRTTLKFDSEIPMIPEPLRRQKNRLEAYLRDALFGRRIFFPVRQAYQFVFNRDKLRKRSEMRSFYSRYIRPGDLVFDVGANVGIYSEIFTELGARVIAIEPNPTCLALLRRLAGIRKKVTVEASAVGDTRGKIILQLCDNSQLSTANLQWRKHVQHSPLHSSCSWLGELEVELTTLDDLAQKYGIPKFVKIDIEGFDDRAMNAMTFSPEALTFEFNRLLPDVAMRCLQAKAIASGYEFNLICGERMKYASCKWLSNEAFRAQLDSLAGEEQNADVVARRVQ